MSDTYEVQVQVKHDLDRGFYEARALFWEFKSESKASVVSEACPSRSRERAIAYALTELAVKLSAGR